MKKKIIYAACLFLLVLTAPSCQKKCSFCKLVERTSNGDIVKSGSETEYCGADLIAIKAIPPAPVGNNTAKYECN